LINVVCLVLLAILLAALPGLVGCAKEKEEVQEIVYGFLWDFTGRAALGVKQFYDGMMDYLRMTEEEEPISGVKITVTTYDTKSETGRVPIGYKWLKGHGAVFMSAAPQDTELLRSQFEADEIPFFCGSEIASLLDSKWSFFLFPPVKCQVEVLMHWIMDTWDYGKGKPKIGLVSLSGVPFYEEQRDTAEALYEAYPEGFESFKAEMSPVGTMTWATEIRRLMDSDFIIATMSGPPLAAFTKEARDRGYENRLIAPFESYWSYWSLIKGAVPPQALDGIVTSSYQPLWDDPVPFISQLKEYVLTYRPGDAEALFETSGQITGWATGVVLVDVVRRAVEEAGAEKIDGRVLRDALTETDIDMTAEGFGNIWKVNLAEDINCFVQTIKLYQYGAAEDEWVAVSDWIRPPSLGD